jgi:hypothetical protein
MARAAEWPDTVANFEYNRGQIFGVPVTGTHPRAGDVLVWTKSPSGRLRVIVKNGHKHRSRIHLPDGTTKKVLNSELETT